MAPEPLRQVVHDLAAVRHEEHLSLLPRVLRHEVRGPPAWKPLLSALLAPFVPARPDVITPCYDDNMMVRTQISVDKELYRRAKSLAKRQGTSLAELCRRGLEELVGREPSDKRWMQLAGTMEGSENDSASVDEVVYGREAP